MRSRLSCGCKQMLRGLSRQPVSTVGSALGLARSKMRSLDSCPAADWTFQHYVRRSEAWRQPIIQACLL